jgi:hypothetical protein
MCLTYFTNLILLDSIAVMVILLMYGKYGAVPQTLRSSFCWIFNLPEQI